MTKNNITKKEVIKRLFKHYSEDKIKQFLTQDKSVFEGIVSFKDLGPCVVRYFVNVELRLLYRCSTKMKTIPMEGKKLREIKWKLSSKECLKILSQ